jgi:type II secretory pathway pseudopilin PulG
MVKTQIKQSGFFIVELLIMIVVIGIIATVTMNYYNSNQQKPITNVRQEAVEISLQSDLATASAQLKLYQVQHGAFPDSNDCSANPVAGSICLKASKDNVFDYQPNNTSDPQTFNLIETNDGVSYFITNDSAPSIIPSTSTTK